MLLADLAERSGINAVADRVCLFLAGAICGYLLSDGSRAHFPSLADMWLLSLCLCIVVTLLISKFRRRQRRL